MDTLKRFYRNVLQNRLAFVSGTHEDRIHSLELESHLATVQYNDFILTDAIRPSLALAVIPQQGYKFEQTEKHCDYEGRSRRDTEQKGQSERVRSRWSSPILGISVSLESLFDVFLELLTPLGDTVHAALDTSHRYTGRYRADLHREHIDLPVLKSFLYEYEDLLLNDGCTGISVFSPKIRTEVRLDEHKLIFVRAHTRRSGAFLPFEDILRKNHVDFNATMPLLTDAEHVHITREEYAQRFKSLQMSLGMDESFLPAR